MKNILEVKNIGKKYQNKEDGSVINQVVQKLCQ